MGFCLNINCWLGTQNVHSIDKREKRNWTVRKGEGIEKDIKVEVDGVEE